MAINGRIDIARQVIQKQATDEYVQIQNVYGELFCWYSHTYFHFNSQILFLYFDGN